MLTVSVALCAGAVFAGPLSAQSEGPVISAEPSPSDAPARGGLASPVVTLDQDVLFAQSAFGRRVQEELERDRAALAQENRRIEAELAEEELTLTDQRDSTPPDEFARLANAFDAKVETVRKTQADKSALLQQRLDLERQTFLSEAAPVLAEVMRARGAVVVIDRNAILLAFEGVDITETAIAAIDTAIGSGSGATLTPPPSLQNRATGDNAPVAPQ